MAHDRFTCDSHAANDRLGVQVEKAAQVSCARLGNGILGAMQSHLLDMLDDDEQREVLAAARRRRFKRNEVVFHDGDPGDTLHMIVKGHFAIRFTTPLGDQATVRVLSLIHI